MAAKEEKEFAEFAANNSVFVKDAWETALDETHWDGKSIPVATLKLPEDEDLCGFSGFKTNRRISRLFNIMLKEAGETLRVDEVLILDQYLGKMKITFKETLIKK